MCYNLIIVCAGEKQDARGRKAAGRDHFFAGRKKLLVSYDIIILRYKAQEGVFMLKTKAIAIIFSDFKNDYNDEYILGIQQQANAYGYRTFTFSMPQTSELYTNNEEWVYSLIDFERYDGIIFVEHTFSTHKSLIPPIEKALHEKCRCPVVVIGNSQLLPNVVSLDNRESFERVTEHLIKVHGCRLIYCLGGDKNIADDCIDGFVSVMKRNGLPCGDENLLYGGYWISGAEALAKDIAFGTIEKPDAIVCLNDEIAYALIKQLFFVGLRVPDDLLVTGFNNAASSSLKARRNPSRNASKYNCIAPRSLYFARSSKNTTLFSSVTGFTLSGSTDGISPSWSA